MYSPQDPPQSRYDSPGGVEDDLGLEGPSAVDKAKDMAGGAGSLVKAHWKKAVLALIILAALFLVYDYFFASIKTVNFSLTDTEGARLSGAGIKILDKSGNETAKIGSNLSVALRRGEYTARVSLTGYKPVSGKQFTVEDNPTTVPIEMEKDYDIELLVDDTSFPKKLVEGQKTGINFTIKNNKTEPQQVELAFEGAFEDKYMTTSDPAPILAAQGETKAFVIMNFKENLNPSLIKNDLKGTIRIKGLNNSKAKIEILFDLQKFDRTKVKLTGTATFGTISEGKTSAPKQITIENKLDYPLQEVQFDVDIKTTQFADPLKVKKWFLFDTPMPIQTIAPGDKIIVGMTASVPIGEIPFEGSAKTDPISGKLYVHTSFWQEEINLTISAQKSNVALAFSGLSTSSTVSFDKGKGQFPPKTGILSIKNTGDLPVKLLNLSVSCTPTGNWSNPNIVLLSPTSFEEIPAGATKQASYTIQLPNDAEDQDNASCTISAKYDDPRGGIDRQQTDYLFIVKAQVS